jgi:hypothetical protein
MIGGFSAALWGAATRGDLPEWYNSPAVWFLVVWIPGMFFVQDSVDLHVKVLARNKDGSDRLRRWRNRMVTAGVLVMFNWSLYALFHGFRPMNIMELTVGCIAIFLAGNLLIGGRVFDRQLLARILERDPELNSRT